MANYVRKTNRFLLKGMNVTLPGDEIGQEYAQVIRNLRCYRVGEWRQRPGLYFIADVDGGATGAIFWIGRINDIEAGTYRRMVATSDGNVYVDDATHTFFTLVDSGLSSEPSTAVISRPERSPDPYLFLANDQRIGKFTTLGVRSEWGLVAPLVPPTTQLNAPCYTVIDECLDHTTFATTNGASSDQSRVNTTIASIVYDGPGTTPGFASIEPTAMAENFQEGMFLDLTGGTAETVIIERVFQPITSTTIAAISYVSGSTGMCTIQLAVPTTGLERYSVVRLGGSEEVLVLSVTLGLDGIPSFECVTTGTFVATDAVDGVRTFRSYLNNDHSPGETLSAGYVQIAVAAAGLATLSKVSTLNLSLSTIGAVRPIQPEDFIHVSVNVSDFTLVDEIQLQFDCDSTTNDFTRNYFFKSIRPPDLQSAYSQTSSSLTAQQQQIQRGQIDSFSQQELLKQKAALEARLAEPDLPFFPKVLASKLLEAVNQKLGAGFTIGSDQGTLSDPAVGGAQQWTELFIPISSFQRVGSDESRGWANIKAFQISINATAVVNVGLDDLWVGGTFGPDTQGTPGYNYVWVARNTTTGGTSNPSPPTRSPIYPKRSRVIVTMDSSYPDPQADVFDIYRQGGTLGAYYLVGTTPSSNRVFYDDLPDDVVARNEQLRYDKFKPWPRSDRPKSGTVDVIGTQLVRQSGDSFNPSWLRGTQIIVNQNVYTFYTAPTDSDHVQLNESGGAWVGVDWEIPEPVLDAQPLPMLFGPFNGGGSSGEFIFGCGDPLNPGYLYWTNGNDPESVSDVNSIELCSPSEPLMSGVILDGIIYVFSDRRSWRILPSFNGGQTGAGNDFYGQETSMGKGLASPWGLAVGDRLYFVAFDGIYASRGDALESLTNDSLAPLFRRDGSYNADVFGNSLSQIDFSVNSAKYISLTYSNDGLYFTYQGLDGFFYALYYGFLSQGWVLDQFASNEVSLTRYLREHDGPGIDTIIGGSLNGAVFQLKADVFNDSPTDINCLLLTREETFDEYRAQKQIADLMIDADPQGQAVVMGLIYDNGSSISPSVFPDLTGTSRTQYVRDIDSGDGDLKRSVALELSWRGLTAVTKIYGWEPAALIKPEYTMKRATDWENGGYNGPKWLQGCRITADTYNVAKDIQIQGDEASVISNLTITHNGESTKDYWWTPVVTHMMRIVGTDDDPWRDMGIEWIYEPEPPLAAIWHMQFSDLDSRGYLHIRDLLIAHRSTSDIELNLYWDSGAPDPYTIPNSSGDRAKSYLPVEAKKGKLTKLVFTSDDPFALYIKDIEVRSKSWGVGGPYQVTKPFGDLTRTNLGARI